MLIMRQVFSLLTNVVYSARNMCQWIYGKVPQDTGANQERTSTRPTINRFTTELKKAKTFTPWFGWKKAALPTGGQQKGTSTDPPVRYSSFFTKSVV